MFSENIYKDKMSKTIELFSIISLRTGEINATCTI